MKESIKWLRSIVFLTIFLCMLMTVGCSKEAVYKAGVYTNEAEGYYSTLIVEVSVDAYNILDIKIIADEEPEILSEIVFEELPPMIIKKNSAEVDVISGASYTSRALINAVAKALEDARGLKE